MPYRIVSPQDVLIISDNGRLVKSYAFGLTLTHYGSVSRCHSGSCLKSHNALGSVHISLNRHKEFNAKISIIYANIFHRTTLGAQSLYLFNSLIPTSTTNNTLQ